MSNVIVTWMYSSGEDESIMHSQVGSASGTQRVQNFYWRCVFLLFESSHRLNTDVRHVLFANKPPPESIDGVKIQTLIEQYNIEVVEFPTLTKSPSDYYEAWNTQFIVLDVMDWLKLNTQSDDSIFILDSDIIFNKPINDDLLSELNNNKALLYSLDYAENHNIHGLNRLELRELSKEINPEFQADNFIYAGGEFISCTGGEVARIANTARETYQICLDRHAKGLRKFNEEAHLLSYVYHLFGYKQRSANRFIKRIWTDRSIYSNIDGKENELIFWHLPSEKKSGFVNVFKSYQLVNGKYELTKTNFTQEYRLEETPSSKVVRVIKQTIVLPCYRLVKGFIKR